MIKTWRLKAIPFEIAVKASMLAYPTIQQTRQHVLDQYFCVNGNGLHWVDGGLMPTYFRGDKFLNALQSIKNKKEKEFSDSLVEKEESNLLKKYKDVLLPESLEKLIKDITTPKIHKDSDKHFYPLCQYAKMNNVPDNVRPDWLAGCYETIDLILNLDPNFEYMGHKNINNIEFAKKVKENLDRRFKK